MYGYCQLGRGRKTLQLCCIGVMKEFDGRGRYLGSFAGSVFGSGGVLGIVALILLGFMLGTVTNSNLAAMKIGELFPLVLLPSLEDGEPMSMADFRGTKLMLHIWAAW